jgi:hypothetical protein
MLLLELFDQIYPYAIREFTGANWDAHWQTKDGRPFIVRLRVDKENPKAVDFEFSDESDDFSAYDATDRGDQFRIFGTAFTVLADYAGKMHPDIITFDVNPFEHQREPIYKKLVKRFIEPLGYRLSIEHGSGDQHSSSIVFVLTRNENSN